MRISSRFLSITLAGSLAVASLAGPGPTSMLYLVAPDEFLSISGGTTNGLDRIQGLTMFAPTDTQNPRDWAIAVSGDVRTFGYTFSHSGSQFDLAGNMLSLGAYPNLSFDTARIWDGTTDGLHNYSVDYYSGNIFEFDRNWNSRSTLFTLPTGYVGISMDPSDGSFWVTNHGTASIEHYTHAGAFLGSIATGFAGNVIAGLAFDPADGTLWMGAYSTPGTLYQYSQSGALLQSQSYAPNHIWHGMEFDKRAVPEPGTMAALALGVIGLLRRKRR